MHHTALAPSLALALSRNLTRTRTRTQVALLISSIHHAADHPRLELFNEICGLKPDAEQKAAQRFDADANPGPDLTLTLTSTLTQAAQRSDGDVDVICVLYAELHAGTLEVNTTFAHMPPTVQAENKLPVGDDGGPLVCLLTRARATLRSVFEPVHSLHPETFEEMVNAIEGDVQLSRKGKQVLDVDQLVTTVLARTHNLKLVTTVLVTTVLTKRGGRPALAPTLVLALALI